MECMGAKKIRQSENVTLWELENVAIIEFDDQSSKVNTLNSKLLPEFDALYEQIENASHIDSVILISGKKDCFIAGADIDELSQAESEAQIKELSLKGQKFFEKIDKSSKIYIAAIDGVCLGGGLELALACDYRIATTSPKTMLGLPEVMLGLLPGAGGTQRLPRLIGLEKSMQMMLTGQYLKPQKAYKMGLIDYLTTSSGLMEVSIEAAKKLAKKTLTLHRQPPTTVSTLLEKVPIGRKFMFDKALKSVHSKTRGLYPAPDAIINVLSYGLQRGMSQGLKKEAEEFARLSQTPQSKGLISLYYGQNELKKNRFGEPKKRAETIGVIGAGLMGAGIGLVSIEKGFHVRMKDVDLERLGKGQKYVWDALSSKVKRKSLTPFESSRIMSHLTTQLDYKLMDKCDVVIEAVFEDLDLKHRVLKELEPHMREDAVFASNTSALPITEIAKASMRPHNVVGMHYFSPVQKMPLLEVITTDQTSKEASSLAVDTGIKQGKTVIVVKDGPGFYTTRILAPYMDEAAFVCGEGGVDFHQLDSIMKDFGYPVGPMTLIDEVGIDVAYHVGHDLGKALGKRVSAQDPQALSELIEKGALGRKSKRGFFIYNNQSSLLDKVINLGKRPKREMNSDAIALVRKYGGSTKKTSSREDIQKRLTYRMINEAIYCLQEGILSRPLDGDIGAVFGLGFPPFLGGPFRYVDQLGAQSIVDDLQRFSDEFGERFIPCPLLVDMAKANKTFYT